MTSFAIKIIAIICMVIDHVGCVFFPHITVLRIIGRVAFPLFAYLLVQGYMHTSNVRRYMIRLGVFALLSEIIFDYALYGTIVHWENQNIFLTLVIGLGALYVLDKYTDEVLMKIVVIACAGIISDVIRADYGSYGIITIIIFYMFKDDVKLMIRYQILFNVLMALLSYLQYGLTGILQCFCLLALPIIYYYNGERGLRVKYLFYIFYPLHLLIIAFIQHIIDY